MKPITLFFLFSFLSLVTMGQEQQFFYESIPYQMEIVNNPVSWKIEDGTLKIEAAGKTNMINSPNGINKVNNAPMILFTPEYDFTLTAKVSGELKNIYDVAALIVYQDDNCWAKLCYENAVDYIPTVVSVVTREYSDDCNSFPIGEYAYFSVTKKGREFTFFYSDDKKEWKMVRHFRLDYTDELKVGFAVHGSRGDGFTGEFSEIEFLEYKENGLGNLRKDD